MRPPPPHLLRPARPSAVHRGAERWHVQVTKGDDRDAARLGTYPTTSDWLFEHHSRFRSKYVQGTRGWLDRREAK